MHTRLVDPVHLDAALRAMVRGKRRRQDVAWLLFTADNVVADLSRGLREGSWRPDGVDLLFLRDPKRRVIARASARDRVVHTALTTLLEPVFLPSLDPGNLACRVGAGTHRAVLALQGAMQRSRFFVHLDIRSYFASIDVAILRGLLARRVRDRPFLQIVDRVLECGRGLHDRPHVRQWLGLAEDWPPPGRGLPVGAHTSQFLATHVYLNDLDHFAKRVLKVPFWIRYVDDLFLFGQGRAEVREWRDAVGVWLLRERGVVLKHPRARVRSCHGRLDALGQVIRRDGIAPSARAVRRHRTRIAQALAEPNRRGRSERLERSVAASVGLLLGP